MAKTKKKAHLEAWERRENETAKAFEAFVAYRDMGAERSVRKVAQALDKSRTLIGDWCSTHEWVKRVTAWDVEQDRLAQAAQRKAIKEMNERQAKISVNIQGKMLNALNRLDLDKVKAGDLARLIELGMKYERIARGADATTQQSSETKEQTEESTDIGRAWVASVLQSREENGDG